MTPRALMSASAVVLGLAGLALLFAPAEVARLAGAGGSPAPVVLQLWSAALLGAAAADWIGRGLTLGGIYGRALVVANAVHWTVAALVLVRAAIDGPRTPLAWVGVATCGFFAAGFNLLMRRHPGPAAPPG